jgi:hypothetical protein
MDSIIRASSKAAVLAVGLMAAACSGNGDNFFTTGSIGGEQQVAAAPEPKVDPTCVTLTSRIEALRKEGVAEKIEKASNKKYKLTHADLGKADQLTKANAEFQAHCSTLTPGTTAATQPGATPAAAPPAAPAKTASAGFGPDALPTPSQ